MMRRMILAIFLAISVSAFWWLRTEDFEFLRMDDIDYVTENPYVQGGLTHEGVKWAFCTYKGGMWHPLTWVSLMCDASIASTPSLDILSKVMHRHNAMLHGVAAMFLFLLILCLTPKGDKMAIPFVMTLIWAVHPLRAEAICWVTERKEVLCTVFSLATMLLWLRRKPWATICAIGCYFLALLSKSVAVTVPVALMAFDFIACRNGDWKSVLKKRLAVWGLLFAGAFILVVMTLLAERPAIVGNQNTAFVIRLLNGFGAYAIHLKKFLLPIGLFFYCPFADYVLWPSAIVGVVLVTLSIWGGIRFFMKGCPSDVYSVSSFLALAWCVVGLTPMCGVLRFGIEMNADRYGHWVGAGVTVCIAIVLTELLSKAKPWIGRGVVSILYIVACAVGIAGWNYGAFFRNNFILFSRTVACKPDHPRALSHVGSEYAVRFNRPDLAIKCYERSLAIFPSDDVGGQLATVLATRGNPADFPRVKQLCAAVIKDRTLDESGLALGALGMVAMYEHKWDEAASYLRDSAARQKATGKPTEDTWMRVAMCHYNAKDYAKAKPILSSLAVSRNPAIKAKAIELIGYIMQKERPSVFR